MSNDSATLEELIERADPPVFSHAGGRSVPGRRGGFTCPVREIFIGE